MLSANPTQKSKPYHGYHASAILNYVTPRNEGHLPFADGRGHASSVHDNDYLEIAVKVDADLNITEARFRAVGCPALVAAGSVVTQIISGNPLRVAASLTPTDIDYALGRLPDLRRYTTSLAIAALREAVLMVCRRRPATPPRSVYASCAMSAH